MYARGVELRYQRIANGETPRPSEPMTVTRAVTAYLDDKRSQQLKHSTLRKRTLWFEKELLAYCEKNSILYLPQLDLTHLRQWRTSWTLGSLATQKKQESVRQFMTFCRDSGWISDNPAKGLSKIKVTQKPTDYFTDDEMTKILNAAEGKLRVLILLMRWSGLAIRDAVTLERERLNAQDQIFLYRAKTGTPVRVAIPPDVAEELRGLSLLPNPRYFFWNGNGKIESLVGHWQHMFRKLFKKVKLKHLDSTPKRSHPHMLRDTFAVNLLLAGIPMHDVSLLLGHTSIKTTERHYAPFVQARMDRMDETLRATWQQPKA